MKTKKAYSKCIKIIRSAELITCDLWPWLFKLRENKIITYKQFLILAETYDNKIRS